MNNNKADQAALLAHCKGVFSKSSYITVGTSEDPFPYTPETVEHEDTKLKAIYTQPAKHGKTPDTYFGKEHLYVAKDLPFVDKIDYAETQPEKPGKGFYTSDYSKRDEFTSTIRTEQYRELLKHEDRYVRKALQQVRQTNSADLEPAAQKAKTSPSRKPFLYDLVFDDDSKSDSHLVSKLKRDTCNPTALSRSRQYGTYKTAAQVSYGASPSVSTPQHGHRPVIESTFYRKSNAFLRD